MRELTWEREAAMMIPDAAMPTSAQESSSVKGKIVLAAILAAAIGAFFYFDLQQYLLLDALKANRDRLLAYTESNYATAVVSFIVSYCLVTALSLPGAAILTLAGGFLFGTVLGAVYLNVGGTTGATLGFLTGRYLLPGLGGKEI